MELGLLPVVAVVEEVVGQLRHVLDELRGVESQQGKADLHGSA